LPEEKPRLILIFHPDSFCFLTLFYYYSMDDHQSMKPFEKYSQNAEEL
jgi:hypothetical protein